MAVRIAIMLIQREGPMGSNEGRSSMRGSLLILLIRQVNIAWGRVPVAAHGLAWDVISSETRHNLGTDGNVVT